MIRSTPLYCRNCHQPIERVPDTDLHVHIDGYYRCAPVGEPPHAEPETALDVTVNTERPSV